MFVLKQVLTNSDDVSRTKKINYKKRKSKMNISQLLYT